jgi:8-oxo-dGTP diphosphatase
VLGFSRFTNVIEAAGGVVWRRGERGDIHVLLIHRPRRNDWSLPKGKLEKGERATEAALREVLEETGLRCELGAPVGTARYRDRRGRSKRVRYWAMRPTGGRFRRCAEVDEIRWMPIVEAASHLTSHRDVVVIAAFADLLTTVR